VARQSLDFDPQTWSQEGGLFPVDIRERFHERYYRITTERQPDFTGISAACAFVCQYAGMNFIFTYCRRLTLNILLLYKDWLDDHRYAYASGYFYNFPPNTLFPVGPGLPPRGSTVIPKVE
jgi:hypothetical protein